MHAPGKVFRRFELALQEGFVDDDLRGNVRQLTSLPGFYLLPHGLEDSLHSIHTDRDAVDERERLRVFREHRGEHAWDNVSKSLVSPDSTSERRYFWPGVK